jgi:hypothetical protein
MARAIIGKNTYHEDLKGKASLSQNNQHLTLVGTLDASLSPLAAREVLTTSGTVNVGGKSTKQTIQLTLIAANGRLALRIGHTKWACGSASSLGSNAVPGLSAASGTATTIGSTTVNGTSTWHVHADIPNSTGASSATSPSELYISQADFTLVREHDTIKLKISGATMTETLTGNFSRYGEPVSIALPKACRK